MKKILAAMLICLLMWGAALAEVEMYTVNVGKGDAILLRTGNYTCLIDAGKDKAEDAVRFAMEEMGIEALDAVFVTHGDKDHDGVRKWLRKSGIEIRAIYASKYHPDKTKKKHQATKTAEKLGLEVNWLGMGDEIALGDSGAVFRVLAPQVEIPGNEDDNSLVMMLESPDGRILLAGDMEQKEEVMLLGSKQDLQCDVLKVPNHADSDACSAQLIAVCEPEFAVISTSTEEKPDTPDKKVLKNLEKAGCETYITQKSKKGVYITMNAGEIHAQYR